MLSPKNKKFIIWCIGLLVAVICFLIVFPTLLFKFYPYSYISIILYLIITILFTILHLIFRKNIFEIISFSLFSIPVLALIIVLISIQAGWLPYP